MGYTSATQAMILILALTILSCTGRTLDLPDAEPPPRPLRDMFPVPDAPPPQLPSYTSKGWFITFGPGVTEVSDGVLDGQGNTYVYGRFAFKTRIGDFALSSLGGKSNDLFLAKIGPKGHVKWAMSAGADFSSTNPEAREDARGMALDAQDNIYLTGSFSTTVKFGNRSVTSAGDRDMFLARLTPQGTVDWIVAGGGPAEDRGVDVAVSPAGTVLVAGWTNGTAVFGSHTVQPLSSSNGVETGFIAAFEAATGKPLWATTTSLVVNPKRAWKVAARDGGFYLAGKFIKQLDLGPHMLEDVGFEHHRMFLARLTETGTFDWLLEPLPTSDDGSDEIDVRDLGIDGTGAVYVTGNVAPSTIIGIPKKPVPEFGYLASVGADGAVKWTMHGPGLALEGLKKSGLDWLGVMDGYVKVGDESLTQTDPFVVGAFLARLDSASTVQSLDVFVQRGSLGPVALPCAADGCRLVGRCGQFQKSGTITVLEMTVPYHGQGCVINHYASGKGH